MNNIILNNNKIYIIADIHGEFEFFLSKINYLGLNDCTLIVAGDCGFGFKTIKYYNNILNNINENLHKRNVYCYMIRGNHDGPSYFNGINKIDLSNLKTISDYSILTYENKNILCIGGAISIDRKYRIDKYNSIINYYIRISNKTEEELRNIYMPYYYENEPPIFDFNLLEEIKNNNIKINYVISHTSPKFCFKHDLKGIEFWLKKDEKLEESLNEESETMSLIYNKLINDGHKIEKWVYGHFHEHNEEIINDIKFIALANFDYLSDIELL